MSQPRAEGAVGAGTDARHAAGLLTAVERIELLLDEGSFDPMAGVRSGARPPAGGTPGIVTGLGTIGGGQVFVYAHDHEATGGALTPAVLARICGAIDAAVEYGVPLVAIHDTDGLALEDGWESLRGAAEAFARGASASGVVPQVSLVAGPCTGIPGHLLALGDFTFMVRRTSSALGVTPDIVARVLHETHTSEDLGGADVHAASSGLCDAAFDNEVEALLAIRRLLGFLPASNRAPALVRPGTDSAERVDPAFDSLVPKTASQPYDMYELVRRVVDDCDFFELKAAHARNVVVGFGRLAGHTVGIVANQPLVQGGCLDVPGAAKAARFVRWCDAFGVPVALILDLPGLLPGAAPERDGILRAGAALWFALAQGTTARLNLVTRHAAGLGSALLWPRVQRGDATFAWAGAELGVVGAEAAVELRAAGRPLSDAERATAEREFRAATSGAEAAVKARFVDAVIAPRETRRALCHALMGLRGRDRPQPWRKHDTT